MANMGNRPTCIYTELHDITGDKICDAAKEYLALCLDDINIETVTRMNFPPRSVKLTRKF